MPGKPDVALASMGIYVFKTSFLFERLAEDALDKSSAHDFGHNIIPKLVKEGRAFAHPFGRSALRSGPDNQPYWRDVGTLDAYFDANIDLCTVEPDLDLYDRKWPIWTYSEMTAPAKFVHDEEGRRGEAISSLVSGDCIVSGSQIRKTLLFTGVRVNSYCDIENAVIMPRVEIGRNARLSNVIIDRGVEIPEGLIVGEDPIADAARFRRTEKGICLITAEMIAKL
jgi:glucose-1-phosphate adenylyltransferase